MFSLTREDVDVATDEESTDSEMPGGDDSVVEFERICDKSGGVSKIRKSENSIDVLHFKSKDGTFFKAGDCIYLDSQRSDVAYHICMITGFQLTRKQSVLAKIKWYYRHSEVPENVYKHLLQDRKTENETSFEEAVRERELFITDYSDTCSLGQLRGRCFVTHYKDLHAAKEFDPLPDHFFYVLEYNPETRRLANFQGEIKVGPAYQATLPKLRSFESDNGQSSALHEDLVWQPDKIDDANLLVYLNVARSIATTYAEMCSGRSDTIRKTVSKDVTIIQAYNVLHESDYTVGVAIKQLLQSPCPLSVDEQWLPEDKKTFSKAYRSIGKTFHRIRSESLSHKTTGQIVEFYYFWKKSQAASGNRFHRRGRRQQLLKKKGRIAKVISTELLSNSTASTDENEVDSEDSDSSNGYCCRNCSTTTSKDFGIGGADKTVLCFECRSHFSRYGRLPKVTDPPPYMFKPVNPDEDSKAHLMPSENDSVKRVRKTYEDEAESPLLKKKRRCKELENSTEFSKKTIQTDSRSATPSESSETTESGRCTNSTPELPSTECSPPPVVRPRPYSVAAASTSPPADQLLEVKKEPSSVTPPPTVHTDLPVTIKEEPVSSPPPTPCNEIIVGEKPDPVRTIKLIRCLARQNGNSCSRTDIIAQPAVGNTYKSRTIKEEPRKVEQPQERKDKVCESPRPSTSLEESTRAGFNLHKTSTPSRQSLGGFMPPHQRPFPPSSMFDQQQQLLSYLPTSNVGAHYSPGMLLGGGFSPADLERHRELREHEMALPIHERVMREAKEKDLRERSLKEAGLLHSFVPPPHPDPLLEDRLRQQERINELNRQTAAAAHHHSHSHLHTHLHMAAAAASLGFSPEQLATLNSMNTPHPDSALAGLMHPPPAYATLQQAALINRERDLQIQAMLQGYYSGMMPPRPADEALAASLNHQLLQAQQAQEHDLRRQQILDTHRAMSIFQSPGTAANHALP